MCRLMAAACGALLLLLGLCSGAGAALADSYDDGLTARLRGDYTTAWTIWYRMAQRGDPRGENGLGVLYQNGEGVPQDSAKAIAWFQRAADQDFAKAEYNLAKMYATYQTGHDTHPEELRLFGAAAKQGFAPAEFEMGEFYHHGAARDDAKALAYYRAAAAQHFAYAQDAIGYMYMEGEGVTKDRVAAYVWFALAADSEDGRARGIAAGDLEFITGQMNAAELDAARRRVESCRQPGVENCP